MLSLTIATFLAEFYIIGCHGQNNPLKSFKIDSIFKDYFLSECLLQGEKILVLKFRDKNICYLVVKSIEFC